LSLFNPHLTKPRGSSLWLLNLSRQTGLLAGNAEPPIQVEVADKSTYREVPELLQNPIAQP
jgi:hypothetical protein